MKIKYNPHLHKHLLWTDDFNILPEVTENSRENSPVPDSTPEMPPVAEESECRDPNTPDSTPDMTAVVESEFRESSLDDFDDSGVDVTGDTAEPCLEDVSEEIQLYVQKLKNDNLDLVITNRRINEQIMFQLRFTGDLQLRYEESVDMTVSSRERIHELEEKCKHSSNPEAVLGCFEELKNKNEECCRLKTDLKQATDDMKLWRVRANMLDIDNDFYKNEIEDLRESLIEISRENLVQNQATIFKPFENLESNSQAQDKGSKPNAVLMEQSPQPGPESGTPMIKVATVQEDSRDESKRVIDSGVSLDDKARRTSMVQQTRKGDGEAKQKAPMLNRKHVKSDGLPTSDFHGYSEEIPRPKAPSSNKYVNVYSRPTLNTTVMPHPPLAKRTVFPQMHRPCITSTQPTPLIAAVLEGNNVHLPRIMRPGIPLDRRANPAKLSRVSVPKLVNPLKYPKQSSDEQTKTLNKFTPLPPKVVVPDLTLERIEIHRKSVIRKHPEPIKIWKAR